MPFKSQAQRKFMYAKHLEIAKRWEKETPKGKLPKKAKWIASSDGKVKA